MRVGEKVCLFLDDATTVRGALQEIGPTAIMLQRETKKDKTTIRVGIEAIKMIVDEDDGPVHMVRHDAGCCQDDPQAPKAPVAPAPKAPAAPAPKMQKKSGR